METPSIPVRIVVLDYYMSAPLPGLDVVYSEFRSSAINQVPVLRCFGSTENGKKVCVHIHGVFPYLYIPYDGKDNPDQLMYQIAIALDKAINISFNQASSNTQHVYKISLVSGIPMYGYHPKKHLFFKIYLYNPLLVSKVGALLNNKHILDRVFQPHEIHLNFTLQFMIDYNLHGMNNMIVSDIKYRINPGLKTTDIDAYKFLPANIEKTTVCELEADINADNILNRQEILSGNLAVNPGIAALWEDEKQRRRNKSEDSQLGHFLSLKNLHMNPTKTHLIFEKALKERLAVLSTDKDIPKLSPDTSIYPAETPSDSTIQNASIIDIPPSSSLELSLDDTVNISCSQLNETLTSSDNNVTMDKDAQDFLHMLQALADETVVDQGDESILSQKVPEEQSDNSTDDLLDLSMPLASLTTPIKVDSDRTEHKSSDKDNNMDYFNTTLIPQMDGQADFLSSDDEFAENSCNIKSCNRSMPILDTSESKWDFGSSPLTKPKGELYIKLERLKLELLVNIKSLDTEKLLKNTYEGLVIKTRHKHTPEEKMNETLRLIRYRINKINRKCKIKKIGQILRKNDNRTVSLLVRCQKPKFNVLPAKKWFLEPRSHPEGINNSTVSHLINLTHKYTDPEIQVYLKTPISTYCLYYDGGQLLNFLKVRKNSKNLNKYIPPVKSSKKDKIKRQRLAILQNQILNICTLPNKLSSSNDNDNENSKPNLKIENIQQKSNKTIIFDSHIENDFLNSSGIICDSDETKIFNSPTKNEHMNLSRPKFETDLLYEVKISELVLQSHYEYLKNFDLNSLINIPKVSLKNISDIKCLKYSSRNNRPLNEKANVINFINKKGLCDHEVASIKQI